MNLPLRNLEKFPNFKLEKKLPLSSLLRDEGISSFHPAVEQVQKYRYKRISNLDDLTLVVKEKQGTCSTKHAFLAALAHEQGYADIQVEMLCYHVYAHEFKSLEKEFKALGVDSLLEAHCVLSYQNHIVDATSDRFDAAHFYQGKEIDPIITLRPEECGEYKQKLNKELFKAFCEENQLNYAKLWDLRMKTIHYLSML